jgi:hypothetical protein
MRKQETSMFEELIGNKIYCVHGKRVMLDRDLNS